MKYIFQATYKSGEIYTQNEEDTSVTDPTKSCYFDVKEDEIKSFFIFNNEHTYSANLEDGHFEVDGVPFFMHTDHKLTNYRLVYSRRHTHTFSQDKELTHDIVFCFGWQTTDENGKNVQRIMTIN